MILTESRLLDRPIASIFLRTAGALAAVALAGCTMTRRAPPVLPPTGPPAYWYVAESSQEDGKIKLQCHYRNSRRCVGDKELRKV